MYVHLGQDYIVSVASIIGIFDMDTATLSKHTRFAIAKMERAGEVISVFDDLPRSAVLCQEPLGNRLYLSQISSSALSQRVNRAARYQYL